MRLTVSLRDLCAASLATWRLTRLLAREDGPWACIARLRELAGDTETGALLDCFACLSLWVAVPFACRVARGWPDRVLVTLALSGAAMAIESAIPETAPPPPAAWHVEPDPAQQ
ncbi:MAG: hypothetical protein JO152_04235 [Mycobacteriaceae bacterium]|nr:hypothetical protein [Mycobacteriaceae bacterium]